MSVGDVSGRGNVRRGSVRRGCIRRGSVRRGCARQGNVRRGGVRTPSNDVTSVLQNYFILTKELENKSV